MSLHSDRKCQVGVFEGGLLQRKMRATDYEWFEVVPGTPALRLTSEAGERIVICARSGVIIVVEDAIAQDT